MVNMRLVMAVEDCPTTLFQRPLVASLPPVPGAAEANIDTSPAATASLALYKQLTTLAPACPDVSEPASVADGWVQDLPLAHAKHIPSQGCLLAFARSDKVMSVEEYLELFASPITVKTSDFGVHPAGVGVAGV